MNVGKETLFKHLCAQETSSVPFPGTTVSYERGTILANGQPLILPPGTYSIYGSNEDDRVARGLLLPGIIPGGLQGVVLVADAKNLKRGLALFLQVAAYGLPMVLAVNMTDEATSRGIHTDFEELSRVLGTPVCPTVAREDIGLRRLTAQLPASRPPANLLRYPEWVETILDKTAALFPKADIAPRAIGLLMLAGDSSIRTYLEQRFGAGIVHRIDRLIAEYGQGQAADFITLSASLANWKADEILNRLQRIEERQDNPLLQRFGDWCTQLSTGIPIAIGVLALMYLFIGSFGATYLVDTLNTTLFEGFLFPWTNRLIEPIPVVLLREMIADPDFGVLPTGVFLALGLVLPVLFCFYFAFGILEDSGYLPRLSLLLDRVLQKMGLNGKGVIPLVMGFSCVTMAILTTRVLGSKKERNIATFLLMLGTPCAPLIAVMLIILEKMPASATFTIFGIILLQTFLVGVALNRLLPGARSPFLMELPPMRRPKFRYILKRAAYKSYFFMKEAIPVFVFASLVVFFFEHFGGLAVLEKASHPVITGFMGLPEKSVQVFMKTIIRRESGATELEHLRGIYTNSQLVINLLVMTFLTPCMNAVLVLFKERGVRTSLVMMGAVLIYAIGMGGLLSFLCRTFNITFT